MTNPALLRGARWALLAGALASAGPTRAADYTARPNATLPTFEDYLGDLSSADKADRLLAGHELRRAVRQAIRDDWHARPGSLAADEATAALEKYDSRLAPACIRQLDTENLTVPCADILGLLETAAAVEPLRARLEIEQRARARRHLQRALDRIRDASQ